MIITRAPFALIAASTLLLLAGCSGGDTTSTEVEPAESIAATSAASTPASPETETGQSKADACQVIIASFSDVVSTSQAMDPTDPQGNLAKFKELTDKVQGDFAQITHADIAPAAQKASAQLDEYAAFLEAVAADPGRAGELGTQVMALQQSFTEAGTACEG
ncbi:MULTISPECIES: hypothetical protein [Microbacterium]|uniref:hypothetical protein n=1 Tax=Microbacterium TaxID=33882 RepID=UPI00277F1BAB|nr:MULTISPECIES: hypothetical protein [Microbacterium]MDQ1084034.1 hypothetical protein [Microbacterium sp. SORGH_AS_0344]MDQ1170685.1 hypothetical protein [Microbacterium proteolyticum]